MSRPALQAVGLSKRYRIGAARDRHPTLRFAIAGAVGSGYRTLGRSLRGERTHAKAAPIIWALDDLDFEIAKGEVVGIIGRNGAGKSTLLKILSRITEPTKGWADIRGRVGSLLEIGTGFHPELTGRENIYLYGAILGMKKAEIDARFDEIVEFADVTEFLDTPVKRYSSGMTVRIAFAVAAHLEPDILLVDEVLAVGDIAFQKKCLAKMEDVAGEGRTVLFVSHNMALIQALCERGIFLHNGSIQTDAPIDTAVAAYLRSMEQLVSEDLLERTDRDGYQQIRLARVEISGLGEHGDLLSLATGRPARLAFHLTGAHPRLSCSFTIYNNLGHPVASLSSAAPGPDDSSVDGEPVCICDIPELPLVPGRYRVDAQIRDHAHLQDSLEGVAFFDVEQGLFAGRPVSVDDGRGDVAISHRWTLPRA